MMTLATGTASAKRTGHGFTLVELLLVLTLLVIGMAIVAPSMQSSLSQSQLKQAGEELRNAWAEARLEAISQGEPRIFRCRIGSGWGYVGRSDVPAPINSAAINPAEASGASTNQPVAASELQLDEIIFRQLLVADQVGEPAIGAGVRDGELSATVFFQTTGMTSNAEAILEATDGRQLRVELRGLTGATKIEHPADDR